MESFVGVLRGCIRGAEQTALSCSSRFVWSAPEWSRLIVWFLKLISSVVVVALVVPAVVVVAVFLLRVSFTYQDTPSSVRRSHYYYYSSRVFVSSSSHSSSRCAYRRIFCEKNRHGAFIA